ncbi:MAG: L,D-transpeptidase [Verrucomicrobiae bacterium]|nr:L,D-transpeptidase [Verrucomicrobiae bacterium]
MLSSLPKKPPSNSARHLKISIATQTLELFEQTFDEPPISLTSYPISSSKFGLGTEPGSNKTPLGNFFIEEKIGDGEPERMIFKGRKPTDIIASLGGEEDHILTRILWLGGLDPENANTHDRYIYIHGTNQEELIGRPASHGCIRMCNPDMIALFDAVETGDRVEIAA